MHASQCLLKDQVCNSLQWRHTSVTANRITNNSIFVQQLVHADIKKTWSALLLSFCEDNTLLTSGLNDMNSFHSNHNIFCLNLRSMRVCM